MKYYAVTNDPRELYHYGVKGMKWGQHLFGDDLKPKSQAFKRAAAKLRNNMRSGLENLSKSRATHQRQKQLKAARKARDRINYIEGMNRYDNERAYAKQLNRDLKQQQKQQKWIQKQAGLESTNAANNAYVSYKNAKRAAKIEKRMDKIMKQARQGKLKYGKLSNEQIERVQDRLNLENQTRKLGSQEKTWRQQKKEARRAGQLQGITRGTAAVMEEVARAGAQVGIKHILDRNRMNRAAKQEGKRTKIENKARNKKSTHEIRKETDQKIKTEAYETMAREGVNWIDRRGPFGVKAIQSRANNIKIKNEQKNLVENARRDILKNREEILQRYLIENNAKLPKTTAERNKLINDLQKQQKIDDNINRIKDQAFSKWLIGDKNNASTLLDRMREMDDVYEEFYGRPIKQKSTKNKNSKDAPIIRPYTKQNSINDPYERYDQINLFTQPTDAISKSINRNRRKKQKHYEKEQRRAVRTMNRRLY